MQNIAVDFTKICTIEEFQNHPLRLLPLVISRPLPVIPPIPLSTLPSGKRKPKNPPTFPLTLALNLPPIPNLTDVTTSGSIN